MLNVTALSVCLAIAVQKCLCEKATFHLGHLHFIKTWRAEPVLMVIDSCKECLFNGKEVGRVMPVLLAVLTTDSSLIAV